MKINSAITILIILFSLSLGGMYGYRFWRSHQVVVTTYEDCVAAKGSRIQKSDPPICITVDGYPYAGNVEALPSPNAVETIPSPNPIQLIPAGTQFFHAPITKINAYTSPKAKIALTFSKPLFVSDEFTDNGDGTGAGVITISNDLFTDGNDPSKLIIYYGIPGLDEAGGCTVAGGMKTKTVLGQDVSVCEDALSFTAGFPQSPDGKIKYEFLIAGQNMTATDAQMYKDIVFSAKFTN